MNGIAVVVAGNRHILEHSLQALQIKEFSTAKVLLIVTSMVKSRRDAVCDELSQHKWLETVIGYDLADQGFSNLLPRKLLGAIRNSFLFQIVHTYQILRKARVFLENQEVKFIISGFYGHVIDMTIANEISPNEFIVVDDGNMTMEIASKRKRERATEFRNTFRFNSTYNYDSLKQKLKIRVLSLLCRLKPQGFEKIIFATHHHHLIVEKPDELIPIKLRINSQELEIDKSIVHIIGMPALNRKILPENEYYKILKHIGEMYDDYSLTYFPHPAEGELELEIVKKAIQGAKIMNQEVPYENFFRNCKVYPAKLVGFYSSTLSNIASYGLEGVDIVSFKINTNCIKESNRSKRVNEIYNYFMQLPNVTVKHHKYGLRP